MSIILEKMGSCQEARVINWGRLGQHYQGRMSLREFRSSNQVSACGILFPVTGLTRQHNRLPPAARAELRIDAGRVVTDGLGRQN